MSFALHGQDLAKELGPREITFQYTTEAQNYVVQVREDGTGSYWDQSMPAPLTDEDRAKLIIHIGPTEIRRALAASPAIRAKRCETKLRGIAQTGRKELLERRAFRDHTINSISWFCDYNYSDDPDVNQATEMFQAIAATMQAGQRLDHSHRFDRLGLDTLLDSLTDDVNGGRAIDVQNIRPTLESIRDDERVMERVRRKAAHLLESAH